MNISQRSSVAIVAGGGSLPFAVADSLAARGMRPVIFGLKGFCDAERAARYPHHWLSIVQFGRASRLFKKEQCRDIIFIGSVVRPAFSELRLDWGTLRILPALRATYRGGDNNVLSGFGKILDQHGFHVASVQDIAPDLLMPPGDLVRARPTLLSETDIVQGRAALDAMAPFDIGQAVIVIDGHVVGVEGIEGTDGLLARIVQLRKDGKIRAKAGNGVLVKAPKRRQDPRFDLPTIGPKTLEGVAAAGLAGVAVVAGSTILAEPQTLVETADAMGLFVRGTEE